MKRFSPPSNGSSCACSLLFRRPLVRSFASPFACHKSTAYQQVINIVVSFQILSLLFCCCCCCRFFLRTTCYIFCLNKLLMVRELRLAHPRYFENGLLGLRTCMRRHVNDQLPVIHRRFICKNIVSIFTNLSDSSRQSCI